MTRFFSKLFRDVEDEDILDELSEDKPIVPQIEAFAKKHNVELEKGWKVDLSKHVKVQLGKAKSERIEKQFIEKWVALFKKFS